MSPKQPVRSSILLPMLGLLILLQAPQALAQSGKFTATGKVVTVYTLKR